MNGAAPKRQSDVDPVGGPRRASIFAHPRRENLSTHVERGIRDALMSGHFQPGERLNIRALAAMLGTSATPVREALSRLAADGAVEMAPGQSVRVPLFNRDRFEELKLIRMATEGLAAAQAALRITETEIAAIDKLRNKYIEAAHANRSDRSLSFSKQFRFGIYEAARMPTLLRVIQNLWTRCAPSFRFMYRTAAVDPDLEAAYAEVVAALRRKDPEGAQRAIERAIAIGTDRLNEGNAQA